MNRTLIVVASLWIALSSSAFAALGNTEDQIAELFGKPVDQGFPNEKGITTNMYKKADYVILVQFLRHLSLAESYTRADKQDFSPQEIVALLAGNSNGIEWDKDPDKMEWNREDGKARAWIETLSGRPTFLFQAE